MTIIRRREASSFATGRIVRGVPEAAHISAKDEIEMGLLSVRAAKRLDRESILDLARERRIIPTVEEYDLNGVGSTVGVLEFLNCN